MKLQEAESIANDLLTGEGKLATHFSRYEICGSIRRKKEEVNDIDIVAIQKQQYGFGEADLGNAVEFMDPVGKKHAKEMGKSGVKRFLNGPLIKRFQYKGIMIDLYLGNAENFEVLRLIRTGSERHNIMLTTLAQGKHMKLYASGDGLWNVEPNPDDWKNPKRISLVSQKEDDILQILLGHVPIPEKRD